jgi:hypothetical protein
MAARSPRVVSSGECHAEAEFFSTENRLEQAVAMVADELSPAEITALLGGMLRTADPASLQLPGAGSSSDRDGELLAGPGAAIPPVLAYAVAVPLECRAPLGLQLHAVFVALGGRLKLVDFAAGPTLNDQTRQRVAAALDVDPETPVTVAVVLNSIEERRCGSRRSDIRSMVSTALLRDLHASGRHTLLRLTGGL